MKQILANGFAKVPEVTLGFWIIKVAATTLGETGGDAVTMSMNLGYLVGTCIFAVIFLASVSAQIAATRFHAFLYWFTIVATTTAGTTLADFLDRSIGIGYIGGSSILFAALMTTLGLWYWRMGSISAHSVKSRKAEAFYWSAIMFSQTLGRPGFEPVCGERSAGGVHSGLRRAVAAAGEPSGCRGVGLRRSCQGPSTVCGGPRHVSRKAF